MGEDGSCRGGGICSEKKPVNSAVMSTCSEEDNDESACAPSPQEDHEKELEYGPGIVSKLRTRFLSITLKQQNRGLHRSNMRRSCSLEDLLDQGRSSQDHIFTSQGNCALGNGSNGCESSWSNLKRAKSMDSLLLSAEDRVDRANEDQVSEELSKKESCEIVDSLTSNNHHVPKLVKRKEGVLNRSTVIICDEELPKPDTVKIYKRMFEPADSKRGGGISHSNVRRKPPVLRASAKVGTAAATAKLPVHQRKAVNGSASSTELKNSGLLKENGSPPAKSKPDAKVKTEANGLEIVGSVVNGQPENHIQDKKVEPLKCRPAVKKKLNPPIKEEEEEIISNGHHASDTMKEDPVARYRVRTTKKSFETNSKPSIPPNKPVQGNKKKMNLNSSDNKKISVKKQAPEAPKKVEIVQDRKENFDLHKTEVLKIKKEDVIEFIPLKEDIPLESKDTNGLASPPPPLTNGYTFDFHPSPEPAQTSDSNLVDIRNTADTDVLLLATAEVQQVDKVAVQQESCGGSPIPAANKTPLWQQKPPPGGCGNSMVFDFRGKDVVHHLSVQPVPFGNKALRTRSLLIDGKEAIPYTNGSVNGSARNGTTLNDDEDEEYEMDYSYPPPSGVIFEGENVVIGKGSILTVRNKSLNIQFLDDDVNNTFMYPSESSLLEECESPTLTTSSEAESDATEDDGGNDENDFSSGRLPKLRCNTTIGITGGLATYTPSVLRTVDNFEPGMFRPVQTEFIFDGDKSKHESQIQTGVEGEKEEEEMLKPADPELISAWSLSTTTTSDLLF